MAIKIKRSNGNSAPTSLEAGQLAYVEGTSNGGQLYYGQMNNSIITIGGKKFTDKVDGIEAGAQVNTVTSVFGRTGAVTLGSGDVTGALGFTPVDAASKGQANGVASLDVDGKVPSAQLPSYVDDVVEYADFASFPATGETSKIYVDKATNRTYRWSGSIYVEISASPGTTDSVSEGSTNLYFTNARARGAVSATDAGGDGSFSYNSTTGVFTYTGPSASEARAHFSAGTGITLTDGAIATTITQYTDGLARTAISVSDAGGDGSLSYNNTTGVITYTGPSANEVRAHFSASTGITLTNGAIATTITQYTDALARGAISVTQNLSYNSSTGVITGPDLSSYSTAKAFTGLSDVPASFSGSNNYYVKVNNGATALEFTQHIDDGTF
jgi:methylphosphotriester-DNA--protein-cysteine methyltransferase